MWDFDLSSYKVGKVDSSLLNPHPSCENLCDGGCPRFRKSQYKK